MQHQQEMALDLSPVPAQSLSGQKEKKKETTEAKQVFVRCVSTQSKTIAIDLEIARSK